MQCANPLQFAECSIKEVYRELKNLLLRSNSSFISWAIKQTSAILCTMAKDGEGDVKLAVFRKMLALYRLGYIFIHQNI